MAGNSADAQCKKATAEQALLPALRIRSSRAMTAAAPTPAYIDPATGREYPLSEPRWRSDDGGPLMITPLPGIGRADIDNAQRSRWR